MKRATFDDGIALEYEVEGSGEPVLLIHGSLLADGLSPLRKDPTLANRFQVISYNRQGFAGSTHPKSALSMPEQARDCRNLMRYLNIERAHIVGHSYGAHIAVQLALDSPNHVHSLSLLEGGIPLSAFPKSFVEPIGQEMMRTVQIYHGGNKAGAMEAYLKFAAGPDIRTTLDRVWPGAFEQAVKDADTFFQMELPALRSWNPRADETRNIKKPILFVGGEETILVNEVKDAMGKILNEWFPQREGVWIPKATHFAQLSNLEGLSEALRSFFGQHPLQVIVQ